MPLEASLRTQQASQNIEQAIAHDLDKADADLAERLLEEINAAFLHIANLPGTGSPRYAKRSDIKGLRFWLLDQFPYSVFYVERSDSIDIIRLLHQASDIPQHLKKN